MESLNRTAGLSMNQLSTGNLDFEQSLRAYQKAGYKAAGISFDKLFEYGVDRAQELLKELDIKPTHACLIGPFNQNTERDYHNARREDINKINAATKLGIKCILAVTGPLNGLRPQEAERQLVRGLTDIAASAGDAGAKIGLEPIHYMYSADWSFVHTLSKALDIINEVNLSTVGIFFDTYHLWQEPELLDTIKKAAGKIVGCHINDWRPITRTFSDRVIMGDGCIPLKQILTALQESGWSDWYDVEILSDELSNAEPGEFLQKCRDGFNKLWV